MKTTRTHFNAFKKEVEWWLKVLGLHDWSIEVEWVAMEEETFACCQLQYNAQMATIALNKSSYEQNVTIEKVKNAAKHEVLELLLADLGALLESRDFNADIYEKATHKIINRLDKVLQRGKNGRVKKV